MTGYIVQYGTTSGSPSSSVDVGNVTSRQFTGLQAGATYYFRVVAYNSAGLRSTPSAQVAYTVPTTAAPSLTAVSPTSGPTTGGTVITLTGTNFVSGATVRVGGVAASGVTFVSSTQVRATTPAGTAGARDVQIFNPNGQSATRVGAFTFTTTSTGTLTATAVSPNSGPTSGGTAIAVTGTGFVAGATILIGGTPATGVSVASSTRITGYTPAKAAGGYTVQVRNPNGQMVNTPSGFTYSGTSSTAPTVTAVSPASGPTSGGTVITLTGTNFVSGATVRVGGVAASGVTFLSATQVRATTPAGTAGARDVQIINPNGQSAIRTGGFTYAAAGQPTITSLSPSSGSYLGGTVTYINGSNFVVGARAFFDGNAATNVTVLSSTQIRATTPWGYVGARNVQVTNPDGQWVILVGGFTFTSTASSTQSTGQFTSYLAEGVQTDAMSTQLAIANPEPTDADVTLTFMDAAGTSTSMDVTVPARSRQTVDASSVPELSGTTFSTRIDANQPVAVDRLVSLDAEGQSTSLETAVAEASPTWYFAEGSTADPMELFYLVQNPGTTDADVQIRYLLPDGAAPVTRSYRVAAGSRATIWVDREDAAIASTELAAEITSMDGTPIVVERSLYLKQPGSAQPRGGDTASGVTAPATSWFLEGATGRYATRLLLANPGAAPVDVHVTYQREDGETVARDHRLEAASRQTIDVAGEDAALANAAVGITVAASAPIVAERTKLWGANGRVDDALSGAGTPSGAARWLLAEAELGGPREARTDVVIFNQGVDTDVTVTLLFEDGPEAASTFTVAAGARLAVPMAEAFPGAAGRRFSVLVEATDPAASLVVDRALFWRGSRGDRTAGADGAAVRLP